MNKTRVAASQSQRKKGYGWPFWLWLSCAASTVLIVAILVSAWSVRHVVTGGNRFSERQSGMIVMIAEFPALLRTAVQEVGSLLTGDPLPLLMDRKSIEQPSWVRKFPAAEDSGYLLFSGVDAAARRADVQLIKISDGAVVARWTPDWGVLLGKITSKKYAPAGSQYTAKAIHPVLLADGDIIFNNTGWLARISACNSKPVWVLDQVMHHSVELDESGKGVWGPSVAQDGFPDNPWLQERVRDDALAHVSIDGHPLERLSFVRILRENGLLALLMGTSGGKLKADPIHLNEIKVAQHDSRYWKRGDLLISARHLSTLFLYRPATRKIIWYQTGPWMNQHSVDFVDDHRISVLNNNIVADVPAEHAFISPGETNQVMIFDFATRQVSQPFAALLAKARPIAFSEGVARVLPDGGLFFEETIYGRHLRFSKDSLLWSRVNDYDDKRIGMVSWSRYLTAEEAEIPVRALAQRQCRSAN